MNNTDAGSVDCTDSLADPDKIFRIGGSPHPCQVAQGVDEYHGTGRDRERFDGIQEDGCQLLQTSVFYSDDNFDTFAFSSCRDASREGLVA